MYFNGSKTMKLESGQEMPLIGLGTYTLTESDNVDLIARAIVDIGYRHIDTACMYKNENIVGEALKKAFEKGIKREELFITTKLWVEDKDDPKKAIQTSLTKLGLEYVDLYLIHWPANYITVDGEYKTMKWPLSKTWAALEQLVDEGLTKNVGLSNYNCQIIYDLLTYCRVKPAVNQIELHPYLRQHHLTKWLHENNITPVAFSPLGRGDSVKIEVHVIDNPVIVDLAKKYNRSTGAICLNWGLSQNHVIIPKSSNFDRLKENFESGNFQMDPEDIEKINALDKNFRLINPASGTWYNVPLFN